MIASLLTAALPATLPTRARVASLPGYSGGAPPTAHWTGFVEVDAATTTTFFYYLVESANDPSTDPLVWWFNGGPGASSFAGLFAENGPLLLNASNQLTPNPFSWNQRANVLYVEFGPGIGYSFCANSSRAGADAPCPQASGGCSPCRTSDDTLAEQNTKLLATLLGDRRYFPELAGRDLYLAGESYAGVYIPTLARQLLARQQPPYRLRGLWATDPCTDNAAQSGWLDLGVSFAWQKGLIDKATYEALTGPACTAGRTKVGDRVRKTETIACRGAWRLYDLATAGIGDAVHPAPIAGLPLYIDPLSALGPSGGPDIEGWLGRGDVRAALHATGSPNSVYHLELGNNGYPQYALDYAACNDAAADGAPSMVDVYREIVAMARADTNAEEEGGGLCSVIVSSGDIDPVVDIHGTEVAVTKLGFAVATGGERRPWFYNASGALVYLCVGGEKKFRRTTFTTFSQIPTNVSPQQQVGLMASGALQCGVEKKLKIFRQTKPSDTRHRPRRVKIHCCVTK